MCAGYQMNLYKCLNFYEEFIQGVCIGNPYREYTHGVLIFCLVFFKIQVCGKILGGGTLLYSSTLWQRLHFEAF